MMAIIMSEYLWTNVLKLYCFNLLLTTWLVEARIDILNEHNKTLLDSIQDLSAQFGPPIPEDGLYLHVHQASPYNACSVIAPPPVYNDSLGVAALIRRSKTCNFDVKALRAQNANFSLAIIHNVHSDNLIHMGAGHYGMDIDIPSVFIGETDADILKQIMENPGQIIYIHDDSFDYSTLLLLFVIVIGVCFLIMLGMIIGKLICNFQKYRKSRLSYQKLKQLPIKKFEKGDMYDVCAICLEEFEEGEKLRLLPCGHGYHMGCIDPWLTKKKRTCPVCKRSVLSEDEDTAEDENSSSEEDDENERTPLMASSTSRAVRSSPVSSCGNSPPQSIQSAAEIHVEPHTYGSLQSSPAVPWQSEIISSSPQQNQPSISVVMPEVHSDDSEQELLDVLSNESNTA